MHRKLRNFRESQSLSQAAMGKILGISQTQYHRKETDLTPFTQEEGEKIASFFNVPVENVLESSSITKHFHKEHGDMVKTIYYISDFLIAEVKEINYFLKQELLEKKEINQDLREQIKILERKLNEK